MAIIIIGVLLTLSATLVVSTLFPNLNVAQVAIWAGMALVVAGGGRGLRRAGDRGQRRAAAAPPAPPVPRMSEQERLYWRMPPLSLLKPVKWSPGTKLAMLLLRGYLVISVVLLAVKAIQLGGG